MKKMLLILALVAGLLSFNTPKAFATEKPYHSFVKAGDQGKYSISQYKADLFATVGEASYADQYGNVYYGDINHFNLKFASAKDFQEMNAFRASEILHKPVTDLSKEDLMNFYSQLIDVEATPDLIARCKNLAITEGKNVIVVPHDPAERERFVIYPPTGEIYARLFCYNLQQDNLPAPVPVVEEKKTTAVGTTSTNCCGGNVTVTVTNNLPAAPAAVPTTTVIEKKAGAGGYIAAAVGGVILGVAADKLLTRNQQYPIYRPQTQYPNGWGQYPTYGTLPDIHGPLPTYGTNVPYGANPGNYPNGTVGGTGNTWLVDQNRTQSSSAQTNQPTVALGFSVGN